MSTTQPIRKKEDIANLKNYYLQRRQFRNYTLVTVGLNIPLRISDILKLRWCDVFDFTNCRLKQHITISEQKTGKNNSFYINRNAAEALTYWMNLSSDSSNVSPDSYIFEAFPQHNKPLSRISAYLIIKKAADALGLEHISCHSLRKTFGYHAWKSGVHLALITSIYNHSSIRITRRYLGIEQEDKDSVFQHLNL